MALFGRLGLAHLPHAAELAIAPIDQLRWGQVAKPLQAAQDARLDHLRGGPGVAVSAAQGLLDHFVDDSELERRLGRQAKRLRRLRRTSRSRRLEPPWPAAT